MKLILKREDTGKEVDHILDDESWASEIIIPKVRQMLFNNDQDVELDLKKVEILVTVKENMEENEDQGQLALLPLDLPQNTRCPKGAFPQEQHPQGSHPEQVLKNLMEKSSLLQFLSFYDFEEYSFKFV